MGPKYLEEKMSKPRNNKKKQKTGIPGLSITAKEGSKPPPDGILDIPPQIVSNKIEMHEKAINDKPKDAEKLELKNNKNQELSTSNNEENPTENEQKANEKLAEASKVRNEEAAKIVGKVMVASVLPKKIKKKKKK